MSEKQPTAFKPLTHTALLQVIDNAIYEAIAILHHNGLSNAKYLLQASQFLLAAQAEAEKYSW